VERLASERARPQDRPGLGAAALRRRYFAPLLVAAAALVAPASASAHAIAIDYNFPLPIWLYALAAGAAVLASAPAAAFAVRGGRDRTSGDVYPRLRPLRLGAIGSVVTLLLLLDGLVGGAFGDPLSVTANPLPLLVWVDFWVGLGIVGALVGNLWDFVSPLNAAGRALDRFLARRGVVARRYPDWLGVWPATLQLLAWSWAELVWLGSARPRNLLVIVLVYLVVQVALMGVFGAERWLAHGELFTVFARTLARFAPLELYVRTPQPPCTAGRCPERSERLGCPACWLHADAGRRGIRLRAYGSGVRREPPLAAGGGAFVVAALATVVFDGYHSTRTYASLVQRLFPAQPAGSTAVGTLTLIVIVGVFVLAFLGVSAIVSLFEERSPLATARRYAPTLVPIAAVYFIAHYFLYWFYVGQLTPGTVADPLEHEWVPDYAAWTPLDGAAVWWIEVVLIVWGHIAAVVEAHRVAVARHGSARRALLVQLPLVLLMVAYTFSGLWVLGQALRA
jgi:hypothetical protein